MEYALDIPGFDPDQHPDAISAFRVKVAETVKEIPFHQHRKGQLILLLQGAMTCEVTDAIWMAPPGHAIWIPSQVAHSNRATAEARLCFLFIEPTAATMPDHCCTLTLSVLVRELILTLADLPLEHPPLPTTQRLTQVLLDQLVTQPSGHLTLPVSTHPKIRYLIEQLQHAGHSKDTLAQWAQRLAMSERNLSRLIVKETGLSFLRWRQQLQLILAINQLVSGKSVEVTARNLGYESVTAFITMFKKALGTTPGQYLHPQTSSCSSL